MFWVLQRTVTHSYLEAQKGLEYEKYQHYINIQREVLATLWDTTTAVVTATEII